MIQFARKKHLRDERLLQLILLFSLLRGSPDLLFDSDSQLRDFHERDLALGNSLGHAQFSSSLLAQELHPKSLDRVLSSYQRSVLQDLNSLGNYAGSGPLGGGRLRELISHRDIQAYLLNAETSFGSTPQTPVEGGYVMGPPSPEPMENDSLPLAPFASFHADWSRGIGGDLFEDLDLLEAFWKQDVDLGVPRDIFEEEGEDATELEIASKLDLGFLTPPTKDKDHGEEPVGGSDINEIPDDKTWAAVMNFTVDSETGELLASNSSAEEDASSVASASPVLTHSSLPSSSSAVVDVPTSPLLDPLLEFNLDEALKLVGLNSSSSNPEPKDDFKDCEADSGCGDSAASDSGGEQWGATDALDALNDSLDEMIQASQLHPHHPRNFQKEVAWR